MSDRIKGSLYGLLVGDALGCPVEGWSPSKIKATYGVLREMEEATERWRPRGLHSDDGQQALALCQALLEDPLQPHVGLARLLVQMYQQGPKGRGFFGSHRGTGLRFRKAVKQLASGTGVHEAAQASAGNGVAMMIAPAAWYFRDDQDALCSCVIDVARVKQRDVRGIAAAGAVAFMVAHGLCHGSTAALRREDLLAFVTRVEQQAATALQTGRNFDVFTGALEALLTSLNRPRQEVLEGITTVANHTADRSVGPCAGYALASVVTSVYLCLTSSSFEQVVVDTVNLGGDADTTGAMVGAMAGAIYGMQAIPQRWLERLVARGAFDGWIGPLVDRAAPWVPEPSIVELERQWTELLTRGRRRR